MSSSANLPRAILRLRAPDLFLGLALAALLLLAFPAAAEEVIHSFDADIELRVDGSVLVTETISVRAEGRQIRRGIYRDIFTVLTNEDGSLLRGGLDIISVERDGRTEPWHTEGINNGTRVFFGDANVFLATGDYTYELTYSLSRMARFFDDYDELYWNVTGNFWDFPIEEASARITLPDGAQISDLAAFTGVSGESGKDASISRLTANTALAEMNRVLRPGEGLTIAAAFQKGILTTPGAAEQGIYFISDHLGQIVPAVAVLIVLLYNLTAWNAVGRDPQKGTIIPLFHPPAGFSPALVHYVHRMGWQQSGWKAFTAALISLAVKGLITITDLGKKKTKLELTGKEPEETLPPGEALIYAYLKSKGVLTIDKTTGPGLNTKRAAFIKKLEGENRDAFFKHNVWQVVLGVVISVACLLVMVFTGVLEPLWLMICIFGGVMAGVLFAAFAGSGKLFGRVVVVIWVAIFGVNMGGALVGMIGDFGFSTAAIAAVSIIVINVIFAVLMRAPTVQGRKIMDEIDGFKMYLETAEKERLNLKGEPELTTARFEAILPYAIALGVEKPWSKHFESELARHAVDGSGTYHPLWYSGADFSRGNFGSNFASVASGMSASMMAAQPASSSSSGFSGGGGSSGGGGGGGGGGGW
jgi:uncharacterized membrane protein YgcG